MKARYTIRYGWDHEKHRYTHAHVLGFQEALASARYARKSWTGVENGKAGDVHVWVEDWAGRVMAGDPALRPGEELVTLRLPPKFWHDHHERDLPEAGRSRLVRETRNAVYVEMDSHALSDLRSDADLYTDPATASEMGLPGLAASARATLTAIYKQTQQAA